MKKNILMFITIMLFGFSNAQLGDLLKQAGNKTKEKLEKKAKEKVSGNSSKPVSYTHLDVYKRQGLDKDFVKTNSNTVSYLSLIHI